MKLVLFAHQNWGIKAIDTFSKMDIEIAKVFTHPLDMDKHEKVWYDSVKEKCDSLKIPVTEKTSITNSDINEIKSINPDLIFSVGWRRLLPESIFQIPKFGIFNLHDSLIPKYRGFAPINWAIINGENETGLTIHYIDKGIDTGDILLQKKIDIKLQDTAFDIYKKLLDISSDMMHEIIIQIENNKLNPQSQSNMQKGFFCCRRFPRDGKINWNEDRSKTYNLIRASSDPYPNAFFFFEDKKYYVKKAVLLHDDFRGPAGRICSITKDGIIVTCGSDSTKNQAILISEISHNDKIFNPSDIFDKLWEELG